eukprot:gnl/MRDRNA2_/MRDRNA2_27993_c0_seq1.p2 gnl/MRDRNA2_/MRDRNA2_27993_c0~~gnl/MRDRNA2_/MRDRNA2_27993_c0_seq1.p2  ORF type:complete len:298 (+),score=89.12 gnl/MRDRNA2_/MRDRNA2_27993_c0_seq1:1143-2036(+)
MKKRKSTRRSPPLQKTKAKKKKKKIKAKKKEKKKKDKKDNKKEMKNEATQKTPVSKEVTPITGSAQGSQTQQEQKKNTKDNKKERKNEANQKTPVNKEAAPVTGLAKAAQTEQEQKKNTNMPGSLEAPVQKKTKRSNHFSLYRPVEPGEGTSSTEEKFVPQKDRLLMERNNEKGIKLSPEEASRDAAKLAKLEAAKAKLHGYSAKASAETVEINAFSFDPTKKESADYSKPDPNALVGVRSGYTHLDSAVNSADWTCPKCSDHVFARKKNCPMCGTPKPAGGSKSKEGAHLQPAKTF